MFSNPFFIEKRHCNYGVIARLSFRSRTIAAFIRSRSKEEWHLFGLKVFRRALPLRFELKRLLNIALMEHNLRELDKLEGKPKPRILYIADTLEIVGGVETRLMSQFKYLSEHGITPMLLTEKNEFPPSFKYVNFHLDFAAPNAEELLMQLITLSGADVIEFQLKSTKFFTDVDAAKLLSIVRVGACIHGAIEADRKKLAGLNYRVSSYKSPIPNTACIKNWVGIPHDRVAPNPTSRKALYISRIDREKFPTLRNFVELCRQKNLSFEVAGSIDSYDQKLQTLIDQLQIPEEAFIGSIRTSDFLREHGNRYRFIAGVGQVPLEAAALGLLSVVIPHKDDIKLATALSKHNFELLREWNMVIRLCPDADCLGNFGRFIEDCAENRIEDYSLRDTVKTECNIESAMSLYLSVVFPEH